jgi:multimeric flavodoxin WrbA
MEKSEMKILAIVGSYRKKGNTARIVDLIGEQLQIAAAGADEPLEIDTVYLGHHDIRLCRGCRVCFDRGEEHCLLKDDLLAIKARMQTADGLIVASPVYVDDVSGTTKNWIDRLAHVCHRPEFAGKSVYLVATTGSSPTGHAIRTLRTAMLCWGYYVAGEAGFKTGALMPQDEIETRYRRQAAKIAGNLFGAICQRRFTRPTFLSLMTFNIQQRSWRQRPADSIDFQYWQNQGWLDPSQTFYIKHQARPAKVGLARLTGALVARLVS